MLFTLLSIPDRWFKRFSDYRTCCHPTYPTYPRNVHFIYIGGRGWGADVHCIQAMHFWLHSGIPLIYRQCGASVSFLLDMCIGDS